MVMKIDLKILKLTTQSPIKCFILNTVSQRLKSYPELHPFDSSVDVVVQVDVSPES